MHTHHGCFWPHLLSALQVCHSMHASCLKLPELVSVLVDICPPGCYHRLKMVLLLSLASSEAGQQGERGW